MHIFYLWVAE